MGAGVSVAPPGMMDEVRSSSELKVRSERPARFPTVLPVLEPDPVFNDDGTRAAFNPHLLRGMSLCKRDERERPLPAWVERARLSPPFRPSLDLRPAPA